MLFENVTGIEGRVEVAGLRAVVGMFLKWKLERRGESQSGDPTWTLRAVLSYQKDSMLLHPKMRKRIFIKLNSQKSYEAVPYEDADIKVEGNNLSVERVTLCPVEQ